MVEVWTSVMRSSPTTTTGKEPKSSKPGNIKDDPKMKHHSKQAPHRRKYYIPFLSDQQQWESTMHPGS